MRGFCSEFHDPPRGRTHPCLIEVVSACKLLPWNGNNLAVVEYGCGRATSITLRWLFDSLLVGNTIIRHLPSFYDELSMIAAGANAIVVVVVVVVEEEQDTSIDVRGRRNIGWDNQTPLMKLEITSSLPT
jgi:hypothetical protein